MNRVVRQREREEMRQTEIEIRHWEDRKTELGQSGQAEHRRHMGKRGRRVFCVCQRGQGDLYGK